MIIRPFTSQNNEAVFALQLKYARAYPGALVVPAEMYLSPAMHNGQDVYCAFEGDRLLAYAPVYLQAVESAVENLPHTAWAEIKADPDLTDPQAVKDELYQRIVGRAVELASQHPGHPVQMTFQYKPNEIPAAGYVQSKGFRYTDSVVGLQRSLSDPIPVIPVPGDIELRQWRMEDENYQQSYVTARNECFPEAPVTLGEWQYFLGLTIRANGTTIAAFDGEELVGNVSVYWNDEEIAHTGVKAGYTEFIFVRPAWRGRGIAQVLMTEGMRFLVANGMEFARLEVRVKNEDALGIYKKLLYEVENESRFYSKMIG